MHVHFIEYERATGQIVLRGTLDAANYSSAPIAEGRTRLELPYPALGSDEINLPTVKVTLVELLDGEAEQISLRFVSPGSARAGIYQAKAAEARAFLRDDASPTPILSGEAAGRGMTVLEVATQVAAIADQWAVLAGRIEGARLGAKEGVTAASTVEEALRLGTVDWMAVVTP